MTIIEHGLGAETGYGPIPSPEQTDVRVYQVPAHEALLQPTYPALIALKNGGAFTVTTYRVKRQTLQFITTRGDRVNVLLSEVDRVYPEQKADHTEYKRRTERAK
jgi:hypothetical protein